VSNQGVNKGRRQFLTAATSVVGAAGVVGVAVPFVASWNPSAKARAAGAPVKADISKLEPGQMVVSSWRRQPIYVVRRTPEMVAELPKNDSQLKDPTSGESDQPEYAKNPIRALKSDYLVLFASCTHLGCLPKQHFERGDKALGADVVGQPSRQQVQIQGLGQDLVGPRVPRRLLFLGQDPGGQGEDRQVL